MGKLIVSIDDQLHQAFRIQCLRERRTMKDKLTEFIERDLHDILEMDGGTLQAFLAGIKEIQRGEFITLRQAKQKLKIKQKNRRVTHDP